MQRFARVWPLVAVAGAAVTIIVLGAQPALAAPTMTVSPTSGAAGSDFTVTGTECMDAQGGGIGIAGAGRDANGNSALEQDEIVYENSSPADDSGTWSITMRVPSGTASGVLLVEGSCHVYTADPFDYPDAAFTVTGGSTATTSTTAAPTTSTTAAPTTSTTAAPTSTPAPRPIASRDTAAPGESVDLLGDGFGPGTTVTGLMFSDPKVLGSAVADGNGVVRLSVKIPSNTPAGVHRLELQGVDPAGATRVLSSNITIIGTLPRTGSETPLRAVALVGTITVAAGLFVLAGRRMRDDPLWPV